MHRKYLVLALDSIIAGAPDFIFKVFLQIGMR